MYPGAYVAITPDKPAVIAAESGESISYAQLEDRSIRAANALAGLGLRRGDVVALLADNDPVAFEVYASTEAHGMTVIDSARWLRKWGSVGTSALGRIRICDDDGKELATGEVGTVYFERDEMPFAYHNDPEKTRNAQHPDHPTWSTVGDIGYVDDDGYLFLTDRKAFVIISGGVNIYPQEIENVLALHPDITDVAVIGVPDDDLGEAVHAVVQPAPGVVAGPDLEGKIIDYVRARIAHYKCPRSVDFVDELPRTPTGKLIKGELKNRYAVPPAPSAPTIHDLIARARR